MKRYEKPIVEITKFNMADIIATSGEPVGPTTIDTTVTKDDATVTAVQNAGGFDAVGVFNW